MALKITDLVDQSAINELEELKRKLEEVKRAYDEAARDLVNGLKVTVEVKGDLDKLNQVYAASAQKAAEATQKLNDVVRKQEELNARTSASISRKLDSINEEEKATRTKIQLDKQAMQLANEMLGTYSKNANLIAAYNSELRDLKKSQNGLTKSYELGRLSEIEYIDRMGAIEAEIKNLKAMKMELERINTNEAKINIAAAGSYTELSLQLERMKMAYKMMNDEEKNSAGGQSLGVAIKELDAQLKEAAQDMGEFQRNVGNYAIASNGAVNATQEQVAAIQAKVKAGQELTEQERAIAVEMARAVQAGKEQEQSIKAEAAAAQNATGSFNDLKNRYAELIAQMNRLNPQSEEWKRLATEAHNVKQELEKVKEASGSADGAIKGITGTTADYTKSIETAVLGNGKFGTSVMGLTALLKSGGLTTALSAAGTAIGAFGKALWALATNPYFLAITAALVAIKGLYEGVSFWVNYNEETAHAKRITGEFLDLSNDGLTEMFVNIKAIAETYGKDYTDVLNAVDTLVSQFGADAKEAAEIINIGMAAGADEGGRMLGMIKKFSPSFRDAGLSARQLVAVIQQARSGIFNEEGMNAMKYAFKQLRKMGTEDGKKIARAVDGIGLSWKKMKEDMNNGSITMLDAVQQISAKLKGLPQTSQEVGAVFQQVFGRNGADVGTATIESIADLETNLEKVLETTGEVGKSQLALKDATEEFYTVLEELFGMSEGSWETMKNQIKTAAYTVATILLRNLIKLYNMFVDLWNALGELRGALVIVGGAFLMVQKAAAGVAKLAIKLFIGLVDGAVNAAKAVAGLGNLIASLLTFDGDKIEARWNELVSSAKGVAGSIENAFKGAIESVKETAVDLTDTFNGTLKWADWADKTTLQHKNPDIKLGGDLPAVAKACGVAKFVKGQSGKFETKTESEAEKKAKEKEAQQRAKQAANAAKREAAAAERAKKAADRKALAEQKKTQKEKERLAKEHKKYMENIVKSLASTLIDIETDANQKAVNEIAAKYSELRSKVEGKGLTKEEQQMEMALLENYDILEARELEEKMGTNAVVEYIKSEYEKIVEQLKASGKDVSKELEYQDAALERKLSNLIGTADGDGVLGRRSTGQGFAIVGSIQREYDNMFADLLQGFEEGSAEWQQGMRKKTLNEVDAFYDQWAEKIKDNPELQKVVAAWKDAVTKTTEEGIAKTMSEQVGKKMDFGSIKGFGNLPTLNLGVGQVQATTSLTNEYNEQMKILSEQYRTGLYTTEEYEKQKEKLTFKYEQQIAAMNLAVLKKRLETEGLSEEDRLQLLQEVADAELAIEQAKNEKLDAEREKDEEKRKASVEKLKELAKEALTEIMSFGSAIFDARIQRIEDQESASQEAYDNEVARIESMEERGAISSEEAEKRKTAAKKKADKEQEALDKRKAKLKYQQAVWEKAASIASIGISTAEAIMAIWADKSLTTYAKPAMTALAAGIGAVQLATILATPIPKYAKGTDYHEGGAAIVGDAGKEELVEFGGSFFLTPSKPTLVDLPKGAKVYPDAADMSWLTDRVFSYAELAKEIRPTVIVNNDYKSLERLMSANNKLLKGKMRQERILSNRVEFEAYKNARI